MFGNDDARNCPASRSDVTPIRWLDLDDAFHDIKIHAAGSLLAIDYPRVFNPTLLSF
jgi:hypothetical protein